MSEYQDGAARLIVDLPGNGTIRVEAAGTGVGAAFRLSVMGAQRLAAMLDNAIAAGITRGLGGGA